MTVWLAVAALTGFAVFSVLLPLGRAYGRGRGAEAAVYRDQLEEIERDQRRGLIDAREAEAARVEIARRLLSVAGSEEAVDQPSGELRRRRLAAIVAIAGIPAVSLGMYSGLGSPSLPGEPLSARLGAPAEQQDITALVARVESHLGKTPDDGKGWEVLAPVYLRMGRTSEAVGAWRNALRLLGENGIRQTGLGEALIAEANGVVTREAKDVLERARVLGGQAPKPRFYLALARAQDGDVAGAITEWRAMLAEAPPDAPWRSTVAERVTWAESEMRKSEPDTGPRP